MNEDMSENAAKEIMGHVAFLKNIRIKK